jgi:hypothetical protein
MTSTRQRDPVLRAPLWPAPEFKRGVSRSSHRRWADERRLREGANRSIRTLQGLARGIFDEAVFEGDFGTPRAWDQAGQLARQISERAYAVEAQTVPHPGREDIDVASGRLMARRKQTSGRTSSERIQPDKGELWL